MMNEISIVVVGSHVRKHSNPQLQKSKRETEQKILTVSRLALVTANLRSCSALSSKIQAKGGKGSRPRRRYCNRLAELVRFPQLTTRICHLVYCSMLIS